MIVDAGVPAPMALEMSEDGFIPNLGLRAAGSKSVDWGYFDTINEAKLTRTNPRHSL
jgi:hypothetical protein